MLAQGLSSGSAAEFAHIMIISKDNVKLRRCSCAEMSFCRMGVRVEFKNAAEKEIKLEKKKKKRSQVNIVFAGIICNNMDKPVLLQCLYKIIKYKSTTRIFPQTLLRSKFWLL